MTTGSADCVREKTEAKRQENLANIYPCHHLKKFLHQGLSGAQLGVRINVKKGIIKVLNIPVATTGQGSSVITDKSRFQDALNSFVDDRMPLTTALEIAVSPTQRVHTPEEADTIISTENRDELGITDEVTLLHPGRDMETIQTMLF